MLLKGHLFTSICMQLKEYPVEACTLQLSFLDLSNNSLSGLPPEIGKVSILFLMYPIRLIVQLRKHFYKEAQFYKSLT